MLRISLYIFNLNILCLFVKFSKLRNKAQPSAMIRQKIKETYFISIMILCSRV